MRGKCRSSRNCRTRRRSRHHHTACQSTARAGAREHHRGAGASPGPQKSTQQERAHAQGTHTHTHARAHTHTHARRTMGWQSPGHVPFTPTRSFTAVLFAFDCTRTQPLLAPSAAQPAPSAEAYISFSAMTPPSPLPGAGSPMKRTAATPMGAPKSTWSSAPGPNTCTWVCVGGPRGTHAQDTRTHGNAHAHAHGQRAHTYTHTHTL